MRRRPVRTALAIVLIAVPVAAMVCADVAYRSSRLAPDRALTFGAADAVAVVSSDLNAQRTAIEVQFPKGSTWTWSPYLYAPLRSAAAPDSLVDANVVLRDMADPLTAGMVRGLHGRLPAHSDEAVLSPELARAFGVGVGDSLTLVRPAQTFAVVGIGEMRAPWNASAVLLAPGFDLTAIQPEAITYEVLLGGPGDDAPVDSPTASGVPSVPGDASSGGVVPFVRVPVTVHVAGPTAGDSYDSMVTFEVPSVRSADPAELLLGWLFAALLMGVLGIVVSAAFAVSGRRQLVTVGQLSASGADPGLLRRFLALQGTWTGLVGALLGVAGASAMVGGWVIGSDSSVGRWFRNDGRLAIHPGDWTVIAVTALAVATIAALVPTRALVNMSVLSALGGRRPIAPIRRRQLPVGATLVTGGLAVLFLSVAAARGNQDSSGNLVIPAIFASLAGLSVLAGVCCLCPLAIDAVAHVGARRRGVALLATRSLGRHRARAAALLASIVAVGAVATAVAAAGEHEIRNQERAFSRSTPAADIVELRGVRNSDQGGELVDPTQIDPAIQATIEGLVGNVAWTEAAAINPNLQSDDVLVASDDLLAAMGLTPAQRIDVLAHDAFILSPESNGDPTVSGSVWARPDLGLDRVDELALPNLHFGYFTVMVTPEKAAQLGLVSAAPVLFGRADHRISPAEAERLYAAQGWSPESYVFVGLQRSDSSIEMRINSGPDVQAWALWVRLGTLGGSLLLTALIIALGMALWAAEGRDERDTLVAIGAGPSTLAAIVALKAWILACVGAVVAVPLGFGTLWLAMHAAHRPTTFPWMFVGAFVVLLPIVIGVATWLGSAFGQRMRPVHASTALTD
jgi:putative ABC transport system permease protein